MNTNWIAFRTLIKAEVERFSRIAVQTIFAPLITALLYVFVFGSVVGSRIDTIAGVDYVDFALPGILMLSVITASFMQASTSLYFKRFTHNIEELLVAPIANRTIILSILLGSIIRCLVIAAGVLLVAVLFGAANFSYLPLFFFYVISVSSIFALLGMLIGLWAEGFEQLNVLNVFVITPMLFLGGVFYSITMLPALMQKVIIFNPFFYFVDGIRFSMIGIAESHLLLGVAFILSLNIGLFLLVWYLFRIGYKIRE